MLLQVPYWSLPVIRAGGTPLGGLSRPIWGQAIGMPGLHPYGIVTVPTKKCAIPYLASAYSTAQLNRPKNFLSICVLGQFAPSLAVLPSLYSLLLFSFPLLLCLVYLDSWWFFSLSFPH